MLVVAVVVFPHRKFLRFRGTFTCHRHSTSALSSTLNIKVILKKAAIRRAVRRHIK